MSNQKETAVEQLSALILSQAREELAAIGWCQVEASGRHVHLSAKDAMLLFGDDYALIMAKYLSQPGQFASEQRVSLVGPKGRLDDAVIIGPERSRTQIEVSKTDAMLLGVDPPCRDSGNLEGTPSIRLEYKQNVLQTEGGVIIAERHIHMKPKAAAALGLSDNDRVDFVLDSPRPLTFMDVKVRVAETADNFMHIDYDEANAAGFSTGMFGFICKDCSSPERRVCMDTDKLVDEVVRRLVDKLKLEAAGQKHDAVSAATTTAGGCGCSSGASQKTVLTKKKLITETEAMGMAKHSTVQLGKGTLITPLAQDILRERNITVEFG